MNCKRAVQLVPAFLKDELDTDDLRDFIEHVDTCEECREELTIEFLVKEGIIHLESGEVFDLGRELGARMKAANHRLRIRENVKIIYYAISGLVAVELVTVILILVFLY
ncbi:MAG: zf-HC2 domain-containing protein [Lachnospiraceae bacterium]|nr:zf-HC2 domain-containing protein [Lachnospiraceae bacterium]